MRALGLSEVLLATLGKSGFYRWIRRQAGTMTVTRFYERFFILIRLCLAYFYRFTPKCPHHFTPPPPYGKYIFSDIVLVN